MKSERKGLKKEENLTRIFRSISTALSARNTNNYCTNQMRTAVNNSRTDINKKKASETRYWRSRLWLQKLQNEEALIGNHIKNLILKLSYIFSFRLI